MRICKRPENLGAAARRQRSAGFTIIELMVVVCVLGVLSAIALSEIMNYRRTAVDARAKSDLRNAATAEEAFFLASGDYLSCANATCSQLPNFRMSAGVSISFVADNGPQPTFSGTAYVNGGNKTFLYDSAAGGMVR
jgi:prepilin-type N-terminal cleavage/methylation domain-containing protein